MTETPKKRGRPKKTLAPSRTTPPIRTIDSKLITEAAESFEFLSGRRIRIKTVLPTNGECVEVIVTPPVVGVIKACEILLSKTSETITPLATAALELSVEQEIAIRTADLKRQRISSASLGAQEEFDAAVNTLQDLKETILATANQDTLLTALAQRTEESDVRRDWLGQFWDILLKGTVLEPEDVRPTYLGLDIGLAQDVVAHWNSTPLVLGSRPSVIQAEKLQAQIGQKA